MRVNTLKSTGDVVIEKLLAILQERGWQNVSAEEAITPCDAVGSDGVPLESTRTACGPNGSTPSSHLSKCDIPGLDYLVFISGLGPLTVNYKYEENIPPKEVIVSRKCAEAVLRGAQVGIVKLLVFVFVQLSDINDKSKIEHTSVVLLKVMISSILQLLVL